MSASGITTCVLDLLQHTTTPKARHLSLTQPSREPVGIEKLPVEILDQITAHLPVFSALWLHQTSKTLAFKVQLDNNFWRKSIMNEQALPYLWDLDLEELDKRRRDQSKASPDSDAMWDWREVGQLLATQYFPLKCSDPRITNLPDGIWNRKRIWGIIGEAYRQDFSQSPIEEPSDSAIEERKCREPVFGWQLEEIMDDLGHYS